MTHDAFLTPLPHVRKIAVLHPGTIGDFVFSLPALHALRQAYPQAEIVYLGKPWHADFLDGRPGPVDRVEVVPPCPGISAPPDAQGDTDAIENFVDRMRGAGFDLALQLHDGGHHANPFLLRLGARFAIGLKAHDAEPLERWIACDGWHNKRLQLLEVAALAGADTLRIGRELQVIERDRQEAAHAIAPDPGNPLVLLQPGAGDPRRRWPIQHFAAIADALIEEAGALVAINGTQQESALVRQIQGQMRYRAVDLSGRLSLSGLCGLLERAALLVSNDSGPLHLGLAIGTPCVGIYWLTKLIESGPLRQQGHRAALSARVHCPVCGALNLSSRCAHDVSFVAELPVEEVKTMAMELLHASHSHQPRG